MPFINKMATLLNDYLHFILDNLMDLTDELKAFVATAQTGSFTAAADQLGVSNRLTSKYVAALEQRLGTRLLQRTTRRVGLTPAGEDLLARAPALLGELDDLLATVAEGSRGLSGTIRLSAPLTFGEIYVSGMLARFARAHPDLSLDLRLTDAFSDLAADGIDLAFRIGRLDNLTLKARAFGRVRSVVVASPAYLAEHGTPATPTDLTNHACIIDTNRRTPRRWIFASEQEIAVNGRFQVNSARAAALLASDGLGLAYIPRFAVCGELDDGTLVSVLHDHTSDAGTLSAVYLEGRVLPRKVRALIDFAAEDIRTANIL